MYMNSRRNNWSMAECSPHKAACCSVE